MSASHIPNLLTGSHRGGRRGGRGTISQGNEAEVIAKQQDSIIQATDTDASVSRLSAVQAGYLTDPFASDFAPSPIPSGGFRRLPIINRGMLCKITKECDLT